METMWLPSSSKNANAAKRNNMYADVLIAEIGSTTTLVSAFALGDSPRLLGQWQAATTVLEGDGADQSFVNDGFDRRAVIVGAIGLAANSGTWAGGRRGLHGWLLTVRCQHS